MALTPNQAGRLYDRIGRVQDWQAFYEDITIDRLFAGAAFGPDQRILEFGCGTGRLAERLLRETPATTTYLGVDISPRMIELAASRLAGFADRSEVLLVDGSLPLPADGRSADRVVSTFVFDLLDADHALAVLDDLRRILKPGGQLCLASLTNGDGFLERALCRTWTGMWRIAPTLVGGCRPINLNSMLADHWQIEHHSRVHRWGLVTEVAIAGPIGPR